MPSWIVLLVPPYGNLAVLAMDAELWLEQRRLSCTPTHGLRGAGAVALPREMAITQPHFKDTRVQLALANFFLARNELFKNVDN